MPASTGPAWAWGLDDDQRAAAEDRSSALLIVAGAGTGKTRTLVARLARLLGDGTAPDRGILAELAERDATVTELSAPFPMSMPAVSRHLKVLEEAALISRRRSGKWRASHLETAPLREAADWIDHFRRFWNTSLDRLDTHLAAVQAADRLDKKGH